MPTQPDSSPEPERPSDQPGGTRSKIVTLADAKHFLERALGLSGKEHWAAFEYDSQKGREIECLRRWADQSGAWADHLNISTWKGGPGMGEHDLMKVENRVWKATKGGKFGIYLNCTGRAMADPIRQLQKVSGTPHQYISRLVLLNEWCRELKGLADLPELTRFEGVATLDDEFSIITSQPCFPHDSDQPRADEVRGWFGSLGFLAATAGIHYPEKDNLAIFDVKPANAIRSGGIIVPIDVIPIRPHGVMKSVLREVLDLH